MFRSQSKSKSLRVQRQTIRLLGGAALGAAQGGTILSPTRNVEIATNRAENGCLSPQLGTGNGTSESNAVSDCVGGVLITTGRVNVPPIFQP